jgi:BASS family bile acid:Na+ symporter
MGLIDLPAAGLAWLGRHGTRAVAVSMFVGIALPPLGAILRPYFPETVIMLLVLAFLRVDPAALGAQWARPGPLIAAAAWTMLVLPMLALLLLFGAAKVCSIRRGWRLRSPCMQSRRRPSRRPRSRR